MVRFYPKKMFSHELHVKDVLFIINGFSCKISELIHLYLNGKQPFTVCPRSLFHFVQQIKIVPENPIRNLLHGTARENGEAFLEPDSLGVDINHPVNLKCKCSVGPKFVGYFSATHLSYKPKRVINKRKYEIQCCWESFITKNKK